MASPPVHGYNPTPRYGHVAATIGYYQFTWGGGTGSWGRSKKLASTVEIFNFSCEQWEKPKPTRGSPPSGYVRPAHTIIGNKLYTFGGYDGSSRYNSLHCLDLSSMEWKEVVPRNPCAGPRKKSGCEMVSFQDDKLVVFAGSTGDQMTDEFHVFNITESE